MFYIALLMLILLGLIALIILGFNIGTLMTGVHLNLFVWHPGIPVLLLCVLGAFLGALLLYVVSTFAARRDAQEIQKLRERITELEQSQVKPPSSGPLGLNFAQQPSASAVPMPGFAPVNNPLSQNAFPPAGLPQKPSSGLLSDAPTLPGGKMPFQPRQGPPPPLPQSGGPHPPFFQQ